MDIWRPVLVYAGPGTLSKETCGLRACHWMRQQHAASPRETPRAAELGVRACFLPFGGCSPGQRPRGASAQPAAEEKDSGDSRRDRGPWHAQC